MGKYPKKYNSNNYVNRKIQKVLLQIFVKRK